MSLAAVRTDLKENWLWKRRDPSVLAVTDELAESSLHAWHKAQSIPSEVHIELMHAGRIPDPYIGANEHKVQWVGEREWLYATTFAFERGAHTHCAQLVFEGLDTFCTVYLNGKEVLKTDNMFTPYTVPLDPSTLHPTRNTLLLHFLSAKLIAKDLETRYGRVRAGSCNLGDPSRVYVRKAQYDWRWDWGPELMTAGPWQPVRLVRYTAAFSSVHAHATVSRAPALVPSLALRARVSGRAKTAAITAVLRRAGTGAVVRQGRRAFVREGEEDSDVDLDVDVSSWEFAGGEVELWAPVGEGEQVLYDVEMTLEDDGGRVLDTATKRVGFRRVELVQEALSTPDQYGTGTTFLFEVNGKRIFMGGSNWIPADNFLTTIRPERYRAWLQLLRDGNQNMVRVWGGGIYEPDIFYDICDELGILVWQDFQFACGVYPAHAEFVASVRREAEANVARLRHHPCLALWCGNNEDYQQVLQWGGIDQLPARVIYEEVLPEVVTRLTMDNVPYWRGSPYGGSGWDTADPTVGDVHQWNVWGGAHKLYQDYDVMGGRFVSEFGLPSIPDMRTVEYWLAGAPAAQRAKLMTQHAKAGLHERRFAILMNENFEKTGDFGRYCFLTQVMQAEGVGYAYRSWKREWRGRGREYCGGVLVWQLNDCWPGTSWAIADYFLRPKAVYFAIARELQPYTVGIQRIVEQNRESDRPRQFYEFGAFQSRGARMEVWGTNATRERRNATLELWYFDLESEWTDVERREVQLEANQTTEMVSIAVPCRPVDPESASDEEGDRDAEITRTGSVIAYALLVDGKRVLARHADWPQPYRSLEMPDPGLTVAVRGDIVSVKVRRPVKGLVLSVEDDGGEEVRWTDNYLDVVPGDEREIVGRGLNGRRVYAAHLGRETPFLA